MMGRKPLSFDEASQFPEPSLITAVANFLRRVQKVTLVGDRYQLPPCVTAEKDNEWLKCAEASVMQRLVEAGMELVMLRVQFRMHPGISAFPNKQFYGGLLDNHESTHSNEGVETFISFARRKFRCLFMSPSIFVNTGTHEEMYFSKVGRSLVNLRNVAAICKLAIGLLQDEVKPSDLLILCYYAAEMKILIQSLKCLGVTGLRVELVRVRIVDSQQGKQAKFVITDLTASTPVRSAFLLSPKRLNVALTRAKAGLFIMGDKDLVRKCEKGESK